MTKYTIAREVVETIEVEGDSDEDAAEVADSMPIAFWTRDIKGYSTDAPSAPAEAAPADARS